MLLFLKCLKKLALKYLVVSISSNCSEYLTLVLAGKEGPVDAKGRATLLESSNTCSEGKACVLQDQFTMLFHRRVVINVIVSSRVSMCNGVNQT